MKKIKYIRIKYFLDFPISLILIFIFLPIIILVSISVFITMKFPIFFVQKRSGLNKSLFYIYKFRTMNETNEEEVKRVTKLGRVLRLFKIDELPQLFNILKGEMTLIGPRPLLPEYNDIYSNKQNTRFLVKPGITGLCQIKSLSKKKMSWQSRLNFDHIYVKKVNLYLDIHILIKTLCLLFNNKISKKSNYDNFEKFK
tara:strand:+ start:984 stop:1577 length:594 start_codon:yes stop_codon:yes gene_type:complete